MKNKIVVAAVLILAAAAAVVFLFVPFTIGGKKGIPKFGSPDFTEVLEPKVLPPLPPKFGA